MTPWIALTKLTATEPRAAAQQLIRRRFEPDVLAQAFACVLAASGAVFALLNLAVPAANSPLTIQSPWIYLALQGAIILSVSFGITMVGRVFGGQGAFTQILTLMLWLQALGVAVQIAAFLLSIILGPLLAFLMLGITVLGLWVTVQFIVEVHGFDNVFFAIFTLVIGFVAGAILLGLVMTTLGVAPEGIVGNV